MPRPAPDRPRPYTQREHRLLAEWIARTHPGAEVSFRQRLGAFDPSLDDARLSEAEIRSLGIFRRYVDALVLDRGTVHLYEAKLRGAPGALEQLDLYARLVPLTPELEPYRQWPVVRHLLWAIPDPVIEAMARERGILVHVYYPAWLREYFAGIPRRKGAPPKAGGLLEDPEPEGEPSS